jgi:HAE1 family hydrophobic/amphiphilic exporter-1
VLSVLAALLVLGALTLPGMRISLIPPGLQAPLLFVSMSMDTESSREALEALTRPAEEVLRVLPGVNAIDSRTLGGSVRLFIWPDPDTALSVLSTRVSDALDANRQRFAGLIRRPSVGTWSYSDSQPLVAAAFGAGQLDLEAFIDLLDREVIPAVMRVPGVANASHNLDGNGNLLVSFDPIRATATGTNVETTMSHLGAAGPAAFTVPTVSDGMRRESVLRVRSSDLSTIGLNSLAIGNGTHLSDIAGVTRQPPSYNHWIMVNGHPGASIKVFAAPDANAYRTSLEVTRVLEQESGRLGLPMTIQTANHREIEAAAHELMVAGLWGGLFSAIFLVVFLGRVRLALVVCCALPLSMALALLVMACQDNRMNLFTLMGYLLATGMVIDNAIVVGESLLRARDASDPRERSLVLRRAVSSVAMAIVVSTLTTIAMFLPMAVIGDSGMRPLLMSLGKPIIWSLFGSLAVALIVVPMAFPRLYPRGLATRRRTARGHAPWLIAVERAYGRMLAWLLLRPLRAFAVVMLLVVPGLLGWWYLPKAPDDSSEDQRQIELDAKIRGSPGREAIAAAFATWHQELDEHRKELGIVSSVEDYTLEGGSISIYLEPIDPLGRSSAQIQESVISVLTPQIAVVLEEHINRASSQAVELPDPKAKPDSASAAKGKDAQPVKKVDTQNQWGENRFEFRINAPDEAGCDDAWTRLRALLARTPGVINPGPQLNDPPQLMELALSSDSEERGWRADTVATQVTRFGGTRLLTTLSDGWLLRVGPVSDRTRTLDRLLASEVRQSDDARIDHLDTLVQRSTSPNQLEIRRRDGMSQRIVWCLVENDAREDLIERMPLLAAQADLPAGSSVTLSHWEEHMRESKNSVIFTMYLSVGIIYLLMGILYESVIAPLALMLTVPMAIVFVIAVFKVIHLPVDQMAYLGLFLLVGIVVNHGVVLVDRIGKRVPMQRLDQPTQGERQFRRSLLGLAAAARNRFTPVVLTSLTTIAGAVPMAFSHGRLNSAPINGLGRALALGLTCALIFTLVIVPVAYCWLGSVRAGLLRLARSL